MNWLLGLIPVAIALEHFANEHPMLVFIAAALAILPLAGWLGKATEHVAERAGEGVGGLLNATFGNAAELIIAIVAMQAGLYGVVKATIAGSIIGNILGVLGASMLGGGLKHSEQSFNRAGARSQATMLLLAVIALILPAAYQAVNNTGSNLPLGPLSVSVSIALLVVYAFNLVFSLVTHKALFMGSTATTAQAEPAEPGWGMGRSIGVLVAATAGIAWMSEILVGAIEPATKGLGLNDTFVGVFVVAILGNAAEHTTAITAAMKNKMDLSLSIAIGSSVQVALFIAPVLVLLSYFIGPAPMDLALGGGLVLSVLLSVLITCQVAGDGRSDWLKGVQLLAVYLMLALAFYFVPVRG